MSDDQGTDRDAPHHVLVGVTDLFFYTKIRDALARRGLSLVRVKTQQELAAHALDRPAVTILNMNDPAIDAFAALAHLRSQPALRSIPVLAFANHDEVDTWRRARELGVTKIVSRNEFSARTADLVEELLGGSTLSS